MTETLSLFGGCDPADPASTDACPVCGAPTPSAGRCQRCRDAGHSAPSLALTTEEPAPELSACDLEVEPAAVTYQAGERLADMLARIETAHPIGDDTPEPWTITDERVRALRAEPGAPWWVAIAWRHDLGDLWREPRPIDRDETDAERADRLDRLTLCVECHRVHDPGHRYRGPNADPDAPPEPAAECALYCWSCAGHRARRVEAPGSGPWWHLSAADDHYLPPMAYGHHGGDLDRRPWVGTVSTDEPRRAFGNVTGPAIAALSGPFVADHWRWVGAECMPECGCTWCIEQPEPDHLRRDEPRTASACSIGPDADPCDRIDGAPCDCPQVPYRIHPATNDPARTGITGGAFDLIDRLVEQHEALALADPTPDLDGGTLF